MTSTTIRAAVRAGVTAGDLAAGHPGDLEADPAGQLAAVATVAALAPMSSSLSRWASERPDVTAHTFVDHLRGPEAITRSFSWAELDRWTRACAAVLSQLARPGDRVAILADSGPEYVVAFHAALRAGLIAVPLFAPDLIGHAERLELVLADCAPPVVITTAAKHDLVVRFHTERGLPVPAIMCPDDLEGPAGDPLAAGFVDVPVELDDVAYLQYTSGSTRSPAGVEITHRNVVVNALQIAEIHGLAGTDVTAVSWLPLFHDMGLMLAAAAPVVLGRPAVLMDPLAFILQPARWIQLLGSYPHAFSAGPNFAFDFAAKRTRAQDLAGIDLSTVLRLVNGAEPVLPASVQRFAEAFAPHGLNPRALSPSYGLAEATLLVSATPVSRQASVLVADTAALQNGRLEPAAGGAPSTTLMASGRVAWQVRVALVDPHSGVECAPGEVGEIWVQGPNVARGYWNSADLSEATFGAELLGPADRGAPSERAGRWLRTGDLGALRDGELFVTGRIKDLIVIDGRNIYPHDVEVTVQEADPAIAHNRLAAFSIDRPDGEAVVIVAEVHRAATDAADRIAEIDRAVRRAVSDLHGVALHDLVLVRPDAVLRTSSGKIARRATRTAYLDGALASIVASGSARGR